MNKILVIFFTFISLSCYGKDSNFIPDGKWYGTLPVRGGSVICNFTINKIFIKNNVVNIYGDHLLGNDSFSFKFNLFTDKWAWTLFKINTLEFFYDFSFLDENKVIKLAFNDRCKGEDFFKLKNNVLKSSQ